MITDYDNCLDDKVDEELLACLNLQNPKSFFLFAGAGSGKTRSLVKVLEQKMIPHLPFQQYTALHGN